VVQRSGTNGPLKPNAVRPEGGERKPTRFSRHLRAAVVCSSDSGASATLHPRPISFSHPGCSLRHTAEPKRHAALIDECRPEDVPRIRALFHKEIGNHPAGVNALDATRALIRWGHNLRA